MAIPYIYKSHILYVHYFPGDSIIYYTSKLTFLQGELVVHLSRHYFPFSQLKTDIQRPKRWNVIILIKFKTLRVFQGIFNINKL